LHLNFLKVKLKTTFIGKKFKLKINEKKLRSNFLKIK
jgi:hypothetical protein